MAAEGTIEEDTHSIVGATCVAKIISDGAFSPSHSLATRQRLVAEGCERWSKLRHPNIVPFLGTTSDTPIPKLLMEAFPTNLHRFLKSQLTPPLSLKISVLHNVTCGLTYLHAQSPPVVHGRLSAENVLLDSGVVAKISVDLGVTILTKPLDMTSPYMPPEVSGPHTPRTKAIDIYSMGVLSLFTLTHKLPDSRIVFPKSTEYSERNEEIMKTIYSQFSRENPMIQFVENCLNASPESRPSTKDACLLIKQAGIITHDHYSDKTKVDVLLDLADLAQTHVKMRQEFERHEREQRDHVAGLLRGMEKQRKLLPREYEDEDEDMVTEKEIGYIANFVEGVRATVLGLELGLSEHCLKNIMCDFRDENSRRLEVLSQWVKNGDASTCTWSHLVKALSSIGQERIAQMLSSGKGLKYHTSVTAYLKNTPTDQESKEAKQMASRKDADMQQLHSQLQHAIKARERAEARLEEYRKELDETNEKYDSLEKEMEKKEKEMRILRVELKAERQLSKESAEETMKLKLEVEKLKRRK